VQIRSLTPPDFGLTRSLQDIQLNTGDQTILFNGAPVANFRRLPSQSALAREIQGSRPAPYLRRRFRDR